MSSVNKVDRLVFVRHKYQTNEFQLTSCSPVTVDTHLSRSRANGYDKLEKYDRGVGQTDALPVELRRQTKVYNRIDDGETNPLKYKL
jgi:hypothetical protein